jgi:hypothetical protein
MKRGLQLHHFIIFIERKPESSILVLSASHFKAYIYTLFQFILRTSFKVTVLKFKKQD